MPSNFLRILLIEPDRGRAFEAQCALRRISAPLAIVRSSGKTAEVERELATKPPDIVVAGHVSLETAKIIENLAVTPVIRYKAVGERSACQVADLPQAVEEALGMAAGA